MGCKQNGTQEYLFVDGDAAIRCNHIELFSLKDSMAYGRSTVKHLVCTNHGFQLAATKGYALIIRYILLHQKEGLQLERALDTAVLHGHLSVVEAIHENTSFKDTVKTDATFEIAAMKGHLSILEWLYHCQSSETTSVSQEKSTCAMNWASRYGHLQVVEWLHKNGKGGCSQNAMTWAAMEGHLPVVEWLHSNRTEGILPQAMVLAAERGHLQVLKWLHQNRKEGCSKLGLLLAATNHHHFHILEWIFESNLAQIKHLEIALRLCKKEQNSHNDQFHENAVKMIKNHLAEKKLTLELSQKQMAPGLPSKQGRFVVNMRNERRARRIITYIS